MRDNWRIPAITGMHEDNPGTKEIGRHVFVIQTGASAASMQESLKRYSLLVERLLAGDETAIENFRAEHCLPIPRRFTVRSDAPDYVRAVDLLLAKLKGQPYESEIPQVEAKQHPIPNLTGNLTDATVALVTEGGLVPKGNPDRLESSRGSRYFKYSIEGREDLRQRRVRSHAYGLRHLHSRQGSGPDRPPGRHARFGERHRDSRSFTITTSSPPAPGPCRARWKKSARALPKSSPAPVSAP